MSSSHVATITPARQVRGRLQVPGDKSISHRYAMLAALAEGQSTLTNYAPGADCGSTLACLGALGIETGRARGGPEDAITLMGRGLRGLRSPGQPLDCGNSGTTMRLLAGIVAGQPFVTRLTGDESLSRRPMRRVITPLEQMGARVESADGRPPLVIHGGSLHGIAHRPEVPSAQVKSAVLLAGLFADAMTTVVEPAATRDHTERALATFGGKVDQEGLAISVQPGQRLIGRAVSVPGDISSAAFWFVAAAAMPGSRVEVEGVGLNPTRIGLLDVLRRYGARVTVERWPPDSDASLVEYEPRGTVVVEYERALHVTIEPDEVPGLIDELPALAALGAHGGEVSVRGAAELRVKESDRIATLVAGFRALGIDADERPDGFVVGGRSRPPAGGIANAHGDHRMAMAFAIAGLAAAVPCRIEGADAVDISYPGFFETLGRLIA